MSEKSRANVEMRFANGTVFNAWTRLSLRDSFLDPLGSLDFECAPPRSRLETYRENLQKGRLVAVLVNGIPVGNHLIQTVDQTIGDGGCTFKVQCQTPLVTAYQASADPDFSFHSQTDTPVSGVVVDIMRPVFGPNTTVFANADDDVDARTGKPGGGGKAPVAVDALKHQDCQIQEGETMYAACARIVTRLGLVLRCDIEGNLLLMRPNYSRPPVDTVVQDFDAKRTGDRFLADPPIEVHDTNDDVFSECVVRGNRADSKGQTQAARPQARYISELSETNRPDGAPFEKIKPTTFKDSRFSYFADPAISYKPKIIKDKLARDAARCLSVAKQQLHVRAHDAFTVSGAVDGFISKSGRVWTVGAMYRVVVEAADVDEDMFLLERTLEQTRDGGQMTRLKFVAKDSLIIGDTPS